jgi:hypothetical protein
MSLANVRAYFKDRMNGLGYTEWRDGFAFNNIPETILDKSYHVFLESIDGGPINHTHQNMDCEVILRVFFRGYRVVEDAIDESILSVENIVKDICKVANRTATLLNVIFTAADFNPLNEENDNSVFVEMRFQARVILGVEEE